MKTLAFLTLSVALALAQPQCGVRRGNDAPWRIVGGEDADHLEFPWQISLRVVDPSSGVEKGHSCGGSILSENWVITAAHCVDRDGYGPEHYRVVVGEHNLKEDDGTEDTLQVKRYVIHPQWNKKTIDHDVALIELARPLDFSSSHSHLGTICLPESGETNFDGQICVTSGWGLTKFQGKELPDVLQKVDMPIWAQSSCESAYKLFNKITDRMVCAGYQAGGKSVCNTLIIFALSAAVAFAQTKCGVRRGDDTSWRIVGGQDAEPLEFPWMISLRTINPKTGVDEGHWCGGSIISEKWVLTAAHCFLRHENAPPEYFLVVVGEHNLKVDEGTEDILKVKRYITHPQWSIVTNDYDLALIELDSPLDFSGRHKHLAPVCLPDQESDFAGQTCVATGWGFKKYQSGELSDILQKVDLPVWTRSDCKKAFENTFGTLTDRMLCAGPREGGKGVCGSDSGGPLQCRRADGSYVVAGGTSWAFGCAWKDYPGVFARITEFSDFIREYTGL